MVQGQFTQEEEELQVVFAAHFRTPRLESPDQGRRQPKRSVIRKGSLQSTARVRRCDFMKEEP